MRRRPAAGPGGNRNLPPDHAKIRQNLLGVRYNVVGIRSPPCILEPVIAGAAMALSSGKRGANPLCSSAGTRRYPMGKSEMLEHSDALERGLMDIGGASKASGVSVK